MARVNCNIANQEPLRNVINEAINYLTQSGQPQVQVREMSDINDNKNTFIECQDDLIIVTSKEIILPRRKARKPA